MAVQFFFNLSSSELRNLQDGVWRITTVMEQLKYKKTNSVLNLNILLWGL